MELSGLTSAEMSYDSANRLVEYNGQKVKYDADGNMTYGPLNGEMTEFQYDCRNRLISAGRTVYAYDAENTRISAETPEYTEEYITESHSSEYSRILEVKRYAKEESEDRTESKAETTKYVYGNGLISQTDTNGCRYYHYNHLGSTMQLTDMDGNVTDRYTYGTYGELLSGDTKSTGFLYNGRYGVTTDENGLYYMRARYYNTDIRRFINQDIITGSIENSQSLNRYAYVQGNPVSYTDPFGLSCICDA